MTSETVLTLQTIANLVQADVETNTVASSAGIFATPTEIAI